MLSALYQPEPHIMAYTTRVQKQDCIEEYCRLLIPCQFAMGAFIAAANAEAPAEQIAMPYIKHVLLAVVAAASACACCALNA